VLYKAAILPCIFATIRGSTPRAAQNVRVGSSPQSLDSSSSSYPRDGGDPLPGVLMKLRARERGRDLRQYPLDSIDVFLLSRLEFELAPGELVDVSPCGAEETSRRVRAMIALGLVEVVASGSVPVAVPRAQEPPPPHARTVPPPNDFDVDALFERAAESSSISPHERITERLERRKK
jgi:hypothetical protein